MQFTQESKVRILRWINTNSARFDLAGSPTLLIDTLEGDMVARIGDYIIKGVKGEFYPCKPDIFEMTYDKID